MTAQQQQDLLAIVRAYGNACASTARTPPNSPARQAAARIENDRWSELEPALRAVVAERDALRAELDDAEVWRGLAIQFDAHRMQALWHLRTLISSADHADTARAFVAAPPLAGHEVVNERDALRARLAEIDAQEPVLEVKKRGCEVGVTYGGCVMAGYGAFPVGSKFYARPIGATSSAEERAIRALPLPTGPRQAVPDPVELLRSLGPKPWETSPEAHAQARLISDFADALAANNMEVRR